MAGAVGGAGDSPLRGAMETTRSAILVVDILDVEHHLVLVDAELRMAADGQKRGMLVVGRAQPIDDASVSRTYS